MARFALTTGRHPGGKADSDSANVRSWDSVFPHPDSTTSGNGRLEAMQLTISQWIDLARRGGTNPSLT
jgi:hypothetical protein